MFHPPSLTGLLGGVERLPGMAKKCFLIAKCGCCSRSIGSCIKGEIKKLLRVSWKSISSPSVDTGADKFCHIVLCVCVCVCVSIPLRLRFGDHGCKENLQTKQSKVL